MKRLTLWVFLLLFVTGCAFQATPKRDRNFLIQSPEDKEEYELIIIDPGFDTWFHTNAKPISYYSKNYYETKNRLYVNAWNGLHHQYKGRGPFENYIQYDQSIDYGIELNYQLFWYFKYVEATVGKRYNFQPL
ncbi:DUF6146 family protein [Rapidithrix thailandica]|uniref:DUF6146 family protein n=1 Tax=Rapidithrix thailandica TaxID=413964 RepID=A0AAW9S323_9BACT